MAPQTFDQRLGRAWRHLTDLEHLAGLSPEQEAIRSQAVAQLSSALEDLAVAQEEIRQQNEELIATRQAAEAERHRYQQLFDFAPDAYLVTDPGGVVEEANRAAMNLLNVSLDSIVAKPLVLFVSAPDRRTFHDLLDLLETGQERPAQEWELALQPKDRAPFPAALTVAPAQDAGGQVVGLRWLVRDLTASKRAEERERLLVQVARDQQAIEDLVRDLEQERGTLHAIMENTHAQLAYLDPEFNFVRVNSAYATGSGHQKEDLIGRAHFDLFPDPENLTIFEQVRDTGQPVKFHARPFEFADQPQRGVTYWDWTLVPVKDERGQVQGLVLSLLDATEAERAKQERERLLAENRQQRRFLERLVETAPIGIAVVGGVDRHCELVNPHYQAVVGLPGAALLGRTVAEVLPGDAAEAILECVEQVYRTGQTVGVRQHEAPAGLAREGTYWNIDYVPLKSDQGDVDQVLILATEVTESILARRQIEALAAQAQREADEMAAVFAAMNDGVIVYDAAGCVLHANPAAVALFGLDPVGMERDAINERLIKRYPDGRPVAGEDLPSTRALGGEKVVDEPLIVSTATGVEATVLVSSAPIFTNHSISGAVLAWHDVTARRQAEEALRQSEERYRLLFNGMTEGFALHEIVRGEQGKPYDYRFLELNPAFEKLTGLKRENLLGRTVLEALPGTEPFWIKTYVQVALAGGTVHFEQYSGALDRYYEVVSFRPAKNQFATLFLDVTTRKRAEKALQEAHDELEQRVHERTAELQASEERFRQLAEHIREVFWMSDAHYNRILYVSPPYETLTGRTCQSLYERPDSFLDIVHPEDRQPLVDALEAQFQKGHDVEYRILLPDGSVRWVRTQAFPIRNKRGAVYRIAGIADDITEQVEDRQMLEQRVEERTRELATLLEISRSTALTLALEPMLAMILDRLRDVVYYDGATVFKLEGGILSALVHRGPIAREELPQIRSSMDRTPEIGEVTGRDAPIIVPDVRGDTAEARAFRRAVGERIDTRYGHVRSWMGLALTVKERTVGLLSLHCSEPDYYTAPQVDLALAFANQAAIAIENARLHEQAQALAALEERQRLARELHDAVSQTLFSASLSAEVLPRLWERNPEEGRRCLEELHRLTRGALAEMRTLLLELRPSALTEAGLGDLLYQLAEAITNRTRLSMNLDIDRLCPLPPEVQVALYRIAQEALNNVVKHAEATQVTLVLHCTPASRSKGGKEGQASGVELRVEDDGHGFDESCLPPDCMGLSIMRERAEAIGAAIEITGQVDLGSRVGVAWQAT